METEGYYFFAPEGTPAYPGQHNLWSWNWVTDDFQQHAPHLGEVRPESTYSRPWRNGSLAVPAPPARLVGDAQCIAEGERLPLPLIDRTLIAGIDSRCWPIPPQTAEAGVRLGGSASQTIGEDVEAGVRLGGEASHVNDQVDAGVRLGGSASQEDNTTARAGVRLGGSASQSIGEDVEAGVRLGGSASEGEVFDCSVCPGGASERWQVVLSGATDDFAFMNGTWDFSPDGPCHWTATLGGFAAIIQFVSGPGALIAFMGVGLVQASYSATIFDCLAGGNGFPFSVVGTGAFPVSLVWLPIT